MYVLKDYQKSRVTAFLNPDANIRGTGYHSHHARVAIGNGGIFGQGFMRGTQNQFHFLPDQYSDFPFAVFAEDWGFLGCLVLVCLYGFLVIWAIRVAATARDRFGAVIAIGVGSLIFWHAFFNMGMVIGILPVVGVTLPLFSYGGSSVLTILMGIGLLMNVSMRRFYVASGRSGILAEGCELRMASFGPSRSALTRPASWTPKGFDGLGESSAEDLHSAGVLSASPEPASVALIWELIRIP
jgi:rod shape determining protein RodA